MERLSGKTHWSPARQTGSAGSSLVSSGKPARTCWCMAVMRREVLASSATSRPAVVRRISLRPTSRHSPGCVAFARENTMMDIGADCGRCSRAPKKTERRARRTTVLFEGRPRSLNPFPSANESFYPAVPGVSTKHHAVTALGRACAGLVLRPLSASILIGAASNRRDNLPERGFYPFFRF
jgi:hypothetical protein